MYISEQADRVSVTMLIYSPEPFLSSSIPNLQFYRLPSNVHNFRTKLYSDGVARILFNYPKNN